MVVGMMSHALQRLVQLDILSAQMLLAMLVRLGVAS
jgi:hypothetical protein